MASVGDGADARAGRLRWGDLSCPVCAIASSLGVAALVVWTVAPSVTFEDSGELLSAATTLGVAHPPGYPLWTVISNVAIRMSPFTTPAITVNLLSTVFLGVAGLFAFLAFRALSKDDLAALAAAWGLCLTPVVWDQATRAEIYALDLAWLTCGLWAYLRVLGRLESASSPRVPDGLWLGVVLGCGTAHRPSHLMIHLLYAMALFGLPLRARLRVPVVAAFVLGYVVALIPWLYLPLRSGAWPWLPWGIGEPAAYLWATPNTWGEFVYHIRAGPYMGYVWAAKPPLWGDVLRGDLAKIRGELVAPLWALALVGLVGGWRAIGRLAAPLVGLAVFTVLLFWDYLAVDQEVFFIPGYVGVCGLAAVGVRVASQSCPGPGGLRRWYAPILAATALVWLVAVVPARFEGADRSRDTLADTWAQNVLGCLETHDADVVFGQDQVTADHRLFPLYYYLRAYGYGVRVRGWITPDEDARAWRPYLEWMDATAAEIERWERALPEDCARVMATLAMRRGRVYSAGTERFSSGGAWPESRAWVTAVRGRAPAAVATDAAISEALSWAERCTREQPGDQVARDMGLAPLLEIGDRLRGARESDRASYVFERASGIAPADPRVAFAAAGLPPAARDPAVVLVECRSLLAGTSAFGERLLLYRAEGGLLIELGEWDAARRALEKAMAVRNRPPMMETRLDLARCYEALGRPSDAAEMRAPLRGPQGPPAGR